MTILFDNEARPTMWLIEGIVTYKGDEFRFWYEYSEQDGEKTLDFPDDQPNYDFDFQALEDAAHEQVRKSFRIVEPLSMDAIEAAA